MAKKTGARKAQPKRKRAAANDVAAPPDTKTCRKCQHTKPLELMAKGDKGKRKNICRSCEAARKRAAWAANPEHYRRQRRARYWRHPERERARARAYAKAHPECNRRAVKKWRDAHPDIIVVWGKTKTAIRRGEIKPPPICQAADCERREGLHLHHARYTAKPRDVIALCRHHHEHVHHQGPLKLKEGSSRRWARAPQEAKAAHVN